MAGVYPIASRSEPGKSYDVRVDPDGRAQCPCTAYYYRAKCYHAAQAIDLDAFAPMDYGRSET